MSASKSCDSASGSLFCHRFSSTVISPGLSFVYHPNSNAPDCSPQLRNRRRALLKVCARTIRSRLVVARFSVKEIVARGTESFHTKAVKLKNISRKFLRDR
jgi:hypothetical protein